MPKLIEPRIYRAAFVPAVLAVILVAFSLKAAPAPVAQGLAADALFDVGGATSLLTQLVHASPDRRPGSSGDSTAAARAQRAFVGAGFATTADHFTQGGRALVNVVAMRPGDSQREIVVVAARDARTVPDAVTSAADTAALLELASVFHGSAAHHTLVLASLDGETLGDAGSRRLAQTLPDPSQVDAVVVLSNLAARRSRGPLILNESNDSHRGSIGLERTASNSLRTELGQLPGAAGPLGQFAQLAFPVAPGAQGSLQRDGLEAIRISGSGELAAAHSSLGDLDGRRYGQFGRGALRLVTSIDAGSSMPRHGPRTYLLVSGQVLPGWAISALAIALMFPALVASVDALARARRRRERIARWTIWYLAGTLPFLIAFAAGKLFSLVGLGPYAPPAALDPATASLSASAISALVVTIFSGALGWIVVRRAVIKTAGNRLPSPDAPGAACVTALVLSAAGFCTAFFNPYAALVLAAAVHLWILATLGEMRQRPAIVLSTLALVPVAALVSYDLWRLSLDPLHALLYLYLLVAGGQVGLPATLAACLVLGAGGSVVAILRARGRSIGNPAAEALPSRRPQRIRGPGGHAGPGALGGTSSSGLRR